MLRACKYMIIIMSLLFSTATFQSCKTVQGNTGGYQTTRGKHDRGKKRPPKKPDSPTPAQGDWATLDITLTEEDNPALYAELKSWLGTPYCYGGIEKGVGADCSGMVQQVFLVVYDVPLERRSAKMMEKNCRQIDRRELTEGDLVFFDTKKTGGITHVGIYLKEDNFVHTSSSRGVMVSNLNQKYWNEHFHCAGRPPKSR